MCVAFAQCRRPAAAAPAGSAHAAAAAPPPPARRCLPAGPLVAPPRPGGHCHDRSGDAGLSAPRQADQRLPRPRCQPSCQTCAPARAPPRQPRLCTHLRPPPMRARPHARAGAAAGRGGVRRRAKAAAGVRVLRRMLRAPLAQTCPLRSSQSESRTSRSRAAWERTRPAGPAGRSLAATPAPAAKAHECEDQGANVVANGKAGPWVGLMCCRVTLNLSQLGARCTRPDGSQP